MNSIDTSTLSQVEARTSRGAGKAKADGDTGGQFSETFDRVSSRDSGAASQGRKSLADEGLERDGETSLSLKAQTAMGDTEQAPVSLLQRIPAELLDKTRPATVVPGEDAPGAVAIPAEGAELPASPEATPVPPVTAADEAGQPAGAGTDEGDNADAGEDGNGADAMDSLLSMLTREPASQPAAATPPTVIATVAGQAQAMQIDKTGQMQAEGDTAEAMLGLPAVRPGSAVALAAGTPQEGAGTQAAGPDGGEADQIFRLVRTDGKAASLDIAIGGKGEVSAASEQTRLPGIESVAVLDSRRYLGLAQQGNISAVTAAIAQDPSWAAALAEQLDSAPNVTGKVVNTLKIQLQPIDLGTVTASLRLQGDTLVVDLKVETGKAFRNLSDDHDAIVKALRGHGFSIDQVSVQMAPSPDRGGSATGQGDSQAQFAGQQQAREGGGRQQGGEPRHNTVFDEGPGHEYGQVDSLTSNDQRRGSGGGVFL
ncbi:flagellar hook-length control protein FliK [Rhizobium sp. TRM96647]|uniref:flagellar hook-length control protein FliK n=1 Tax=unclassified Rhizobium TaxID=2613769 RepID=UPI0021E86E51|nr:MULTISPECIES: flagellar hook-length control protein FliK [unclassified Rhizobium]MCV3737128.1 flagellar hook-length control protein FliK [Rhizobium sp. TRM96647]MCV3759112.1 flagellar hook-length control protein FliK [Rhizobium sp. TRM96650]